MRFAPGEVLLRRSWRGGRVGFMNVTRVVADDENGLRLYVPGGAPYWRMNSSAPAQPVDAGARLTQRRWSDSDVMMWMPDDKPYSIWWFWRDGLFDGWYVNLEEPYVRWADKGCAGIDTADHALDLIVKPDHTWRWKDEDELQARTGHPLYWNAAQAAQIRGTGDRLARLAETAAFPFDGTWLGFRPDAGWTVPALPPGHDRPRAVEPLDMVPEPAGRRGPRSRS